MRFTRTFIFWQLAVLMAPAVCFGQLRNEAKAEGDTLATLREFINICNGYKTLPLHVLMDISGTADVAVSAGDTATYSAAFLATAEGWYVKMNGEEQLMKDSLVVVIDNKYKRMAIYVSKNPVPAQLAGIAGVLAQDSSVEKLATKYKAVQWAGGEKSDTGLIELEDRAFLPGTALPRQIISLKYNRLILEPAEVTVKRRQAIPLDSAQYAKLSLMPDFAACLVKTGGNHFYLVKTKVMTYRYRLIEHTAGLRLPLGIGDCLAKDASGKYIPAKGYASYAMIKNL